MTPVLVLGRSGQLARELADLVGREGRALVFAGRDTLDFARGEDPAPLLDRLQPSAVVNTAAYTAVDKAESEPELAFRINRDAAGLVARACAARSLPLVHVSTDFVFDGRKREPYVETDPVGPLSVYGRSKAEGEDAVAAAGGAWMVLRTSWVFGVHGANFFKAMVAAGEQGAEVPVVDDRVGRPTWARDLAAVALTAADRLAAGAPSGVLHTTGGPDATWPEFAEAVFERVHARGGRRARVRRVGSAELGAPAARPANSRLDSRLAAERLGWRPTPWPRALDSCFEAMETAPA